ncbi:MAG TPA: CPBP family intramembrane metalloprotease [Thermoanaerobaculia bacterium]|nr:CPBP family intramembrane metalloprotease [Thermoanaerobaculia bacterium]
MTSLARNLLFGAGVPLLVGIVWMADRKGAFRRDAFPTPWRKRAALGLLFLLLVATTLLPAAAGGRPPDVSTLKITQVFLVQGVLAVFLASWWLLAGRPPLRAFLALESKQPGPEAAAGVALGLIGWTLTIVVAVVAAVFLSLVDVQQQRAIPPLVGWLASRPAVERLLIVISAMTLEEFHFRAFLQRRLGAIPASILFLLAHAGYGEPFFFVGLLAITSVLAIAFARTGSVVAPMLAHGTFDAVQLFIFLPAALKFLQGS